MLTVTLKTFDEFYALLDAGWNCAAEYNEKYEAEHEHIHIQMKERLYALLGGTRISSMSHDAFTAMEDGWTVSRVVGAYFNTGTFVRPDLVARLKDIVDLFSHDYVLHIFGTDFHPDISDFELIVGKKFIWGLFENPSDLEKINAKQEIIRGTNLPEEN